MRSYANQLLGQMGDGKTKIPDVDEMRLKIINDQRRLF